MHTTTKIGFSLCWSLIAGMPIALMFAEGIFISWRSDLSLDTLLALMVVLLLGAVFFLVETREFFIWDDSVTRWLTLVIWAVVYFYFFICTTYVSYFHEQYPWIVGQSKTAYSNYGEVYKVIDDGRHFETSDGSIINYKVKDKVVKNDNLVKFNNNPEIPAVRSATEIESTPYTWGLSNNLINKERWNLLLLLSSKKNVETKRVPVTIMNEAAHKAICQDSQSPTATEEW